MWSSISSLQAVSGWSLWIGGVAGAVAALATLLSGVTNARASELQKVEHARQLAELRAGAGVMKGDVQFAKAASIIGL